MNAALSQREVVAIRSCRQSDTENVCSFLRRFYPQHTLGERAYFEWRHVADPWGPSCDDAIVATVNNQLVGYMGAIGERLVIRGKHEPGTWLVNLIVDPDHRSKLIGLRLFRHAMQRDGLVLSLGAYPKLAPLFRQLSWKCLPVNDTYYCVFRPSRLAGMVRQSSSTEHPINQLGLPLLKLVDAAVSLGQHLMRSRRTSGSIHIVPLRMFDGHFRDFVSETLPLVGVTPVRDDRVMTWKFTKRPVGHHVGWYAVEKQTGRWQGYLVAKKMCRGSTARWLEIADYLVTPGHIGIFRGLVNHAVNYALKTRLDFIRFRLSIDRHKECLRKSCAWLKATQPVSDELFVYSANSELCQHLANGPWHLTSLVSDRCDYGRDEWDQKTPLGAHQRL